MKDKKGKNFSFLSLLRRYAVPFRKHIALLIFITIIANCFTTLQPVILSGVMETVLEEKGAAGYLAGSIEESNLPQQKTNLFDLNYIGTKVKKVIPNLITKGEKGFWGNLKIMFFLFIIVAFFASLFNYLSTALSRWIRSKATYMVRGDIMRHLLRLNLGFFNKQKSGELISRVVQDAQNTAHGIGPLVHSLLHHSFLIVIYSIYLFSTSVWMTVGALGMILLQFWFSHFIKKPVYKTTKRVFDDTADLTTTLQETFTSIRVIKSFGAEKHELNELRNDMDNVRVANFKQSLIKQFEFYAREFLDVFAFTGIFLIAVIQLMRNSLSVQGFLLFIYVGRLLITPINKIAVSFVWIKAVLASYERLGVLFSQKPEVLDGDITKRDFKESIVLEDVSFSYGSGDVLKDISLTLEKGEVLAIVGSSGAGKSTLTDLILRFYDPQKGKILIDGIDLKRLKTSEYTKIFGVVPQESLLFNDTVMNNIRYGRADISDDDVVSAAKIANAHNFIENLPKGYGTFVGDRGIRLSGGQRQRIAIARAVVAKPQILIFDEATSSLDTESERQVQVAIDRILERSTAIVIAHRLSTVLHANKIVVMNEGKVETIGKHNELLQESSTYQRLYNLQFRVENKKPDPEKLEEAV